MKVAFLRQLLNIMEWVRTPPQLCIARLLTVICLILPGNTAVACPATLFNVELSPVFSGPRINVKLYAWSESGGNSGRWITVPFQVDPVDDDGFLVFFKDRSYVKEQIQKNDVVIFNVDNFGKKKDLRADPLPCKGSNTYQLYDLVGKKYAYLTMCDEPQLEDVFVNQVNYSEKDHYLESDSYRYRFNDNNYMLFKEISYRGVDGKLSPVAWDSDMLIKADVKRFFTMRFDSQDIVSRLEESRLGPVANLARVSFFLKILFFKIRMSLNTDVGFFKESGHIPMMINIPVNSSEYLNAKSGILYSWLQTSEAVYESSVDEMPLLDVNLVGQGYEKLGEKGLKYCRGSQCNFKYRIDVNGRVLSMNLGIKKELVARGFFPMYVSDVKSVHKDMGWGEKYENEKGRSGLYFEVSGLPKGGHPWDFWMRLGAKYNKYAQCPALVFISRPKTK